MILGKQPTAASRIGPVLLLALIGAGVVALFAATNTASAQDANRANLPEVAIPLAKCTGTLACDGIVDQSQVGDGSCLGPYSCQHTSPYTGTIGANSCINTQACRDADGSIGANSCNGDSACLSADGAIGAGSCYGDSACSNAARAIGAGSCFGTRACNYVFGSIGAGSCSGNLACFWAEGSIGNNSCHTVGTACRGQLTNTFPVGDCQRNDSLLTACVVSRARLPYVSR